MAARAIRRQAASLGVGWDISLGKQADPPDTATRKVSFSIETAGRFGGLRLVRGCDGALELRVDRPGLAAELAAQATVSSYLGERLADDSFRVDPPWRGPLKRALVKLGWPVDDQAGFAEGAALGVALCETCRKGDPLVLRDYQQEAAERFANAGAGVVVLPCGAGKTVVAIACLARLSTHTLILATSVTAARQWRSELLDKTDLGEDDIGEFSGQFGPRQEEAQRLGRLLRPKAAGRRAFFYTLVSAENQGVRYRKEQLLALPLSG